MHVINRTVIAMSILACALISSEICLEAQASFEVATIKPADPSGSGMVGFISRPGGRIEVGNASLATLVHYAFDVDITQVTSTQKGFDSSRYNVLALKSSHPDPKIDPQSNQRATPNAQEREMLRSLLKDRFHLVYHRSTKPDTVYILSQGNKSSVLQDAKNKNSDPRAAILTTNAGGADGRAIGNNVSMTFLASTLTQYLHTVVLDRTGLQGTYDFRLMEADDPDSQDIVAGIGRILQRLGLKINRGKAPVDLIVVDAFSKPSEN